VASDSSRSYCNRLIDTLNRTSGIATIDVFDPIFETCCFCCEFERLERRVEHRVIVITNRNRRFGVEQLDGPDAVFRISRCGFVVSGWIVPEVGFGNGWIRAVDDTCRL
jgi:hypothetical protein